MNKTLVLGVIYPQVKKYLPDYYQSILNQDTEKFDVLILNDHYSQADVIEKDNWKYQAVADGMSPAQIRSIGIEYAISNGYQYLVLTDTDDYFSPDRVSQSIEKLNQYDFVFNEFDLVDDKKNCIKKDCLAGFGIAGVYQDINTIRDRNIIGLSNSALRLEGLEGIKIPAAVIASDWWLYSWLLIQGRKGLFIKGPRTYYRQNNFNALGMGKPLNNKSLDLAVRAKLEHYRSLIDYDKNYQIKFNQMEELQKALTDPGFKERYIELVNNNFDRIYCGWWSEVLSLKELKKYEV